MTPKRLPAPLSHRALTFEPLEERLALSGTVVDHFDLAIVPALPQAAMDLVGQQRWLFTHASVGVNMVGGMGDLHSLDPAHYPFTTTGVAYNSTELRANNPPATTVPGTIYECSRGNPGWQNKLTIFQNSVNVSGWHDSKVDVVMDKLCYIDQAANATNYLDSMSTVEATYPNTRFVYLTMPLTTGSDTSNILRNQYNDVVRSYCVANNKLLFDLADIESHDPAGNPSTFDSAGHTYQKLYSGYTTDGGHLNDTGKVGRQQAALGWYATAALVAGVLGTPTGLTLSNATVAENLPTGTTVGALATADRDANDQFTYTLVDGQGCDDNGLFRIVGDHLQTNGPLDFETKPICHIRVQTTDAEGLQLQKTFSISVNDAAEVNLDADGNGAADALSDGILILRYLFDPAGPWNVNDALGSGATRTALEAIRSNLDAGRTTTLDADGNATADALSDGILILRYLFDPTGQWNVSDALGDGATRTTRDSIAAYLDLYNPGVPAAPEPSLMAATAPAGTLGADIALAIFATEEHVDADADQCTSRAPAETDSLMARPTSQPAQWREQPWIDALLSPLGGSFVQVWDLPVFDGSSSDDAALDGIFGRHGAHWFLGASEASRMDAGLDRGGDRR